MIFVRAARCSAMFDWGQSLPKRDVRVTSVYPSISNNYHASPLPTDAKVAYSLRGLDKFRTV